MKTSRLSILLITAQIQDAQGFQNDKLITAFAGFGSQSKTKKTGKKSKKKKRGGLISEDLNLKPAGEAKMGKQKGAQEEPQLDRFGLPIRTAENFFPPLPDDTELVGMDPQEETTLDTVRSAMKQHIQLNYDIFDESGIEKDVTNGRRKPWRLNLLHKSPPVIEIQDFFTAEECVEYSDISNGGSETDTSSPLQVNSATFSSLATSKRTSTTWFCHFSQVPTLLAKAKRLLNDLPLNQMEEAQIVRYRTGEEFSWHYDEIPSKQLENGGQRIATLLVYLNTINKGGGTIFRDLKCSSGTELTMRPRQGSALLFFPAFADGTPDDRTLHKGEVAVEKKTIAQMWIHEGKYKPVVPEGNTHEAAIEIIKAKEDELGFKKL